MFNTPIYTNILEFGIGYALYSFCGENFGFLPHSLACFPAPPHPRHNGALVKGMCHFECFIMDIVEGFKVQNLPRNTLKVV